MICQINRSLLPLKLFYLWFYAAIASVGPYLPHFMQQKGFSSGDVSTILGVVPFVIIFTKPVIGHFADKTGRYKLTTLLCLFTAGLFLSMVYFVDKVDVDQSHLNETNDSLLLVVGCCVNGSELSSSVKGANTTHFSTYQFWIILALIVIPNALGLSPGYTIVDTLTMAILKDKPELYGKQRMWMSVGLATAIFSLSALMDHTIAADGTINYLPAFISYMVCIMFSGICVGFIKTPINEKKSANKGLKSFLPLLGNWKVVFFMFMTFVLGMNFGKSSWMTVWYMKELGAQQLTIAVAIALNSAATMLASCFSGIVIQKLGHELSLCFCVAAFAIRNWLWLLITNPWHGISNELLNGLAIGLWYSVMVSYANKISPKGSESSGQSMLAMVFDGLGTGIGNLSSGWCYFLLGGTITWKVYAALTSVCAAVYFIVIMATDRPSFRSQNLKDIAAKELIVPEGKPLKSDYAETESV